MRFAGAICSVGNDDHLVEISPMRTWSGVSDSISIPVIAVKKDPKGAYDDDAIHEGCATNFPSWFFLRPRRLRHEQPQPQPCIQVQRIATPMDFGFGDGILMTRLAVDTEGLGREEQSRSDETVPEEGKHHRCDQWTSSDVAKPEVKPRLSLQDLWS
jgi:hypothetical protein